MNNYNNNKPIKYRIFIVFDLCCIVSCPENWQTK